MNQDVFEYLFLNAAAMLVLGVFGLAADFVATAIAGGTYKFNHAKRCLRGQNISRRH